MIAPPKLFPIVLLRIAGGSLADLQQTEASETIATSAQIIRTQKKMLELEKGISEELYTRIPTMSDATMRRLWITVRRNIHNHRPAPGISRQAYTSIPITLQKTIRTYIRLQARQKALEKEAEQHYSREVKAVKHSFAALLRETTNFQNGLLLSSTTIGASLQKYLTSNPEQKTVITKKERSFMEYLSRMYAKPTPFSSFTHLAAASFTGNGKDLITFKNFKAMGHVQLNHNLYRYLHALLMSQSELRRFLPVKLNPTIKRTTNAYDFLADHDNQEAFQHINATPSLDVFYQLIANTPRPLKYQELIALITTKKYIKASAEEIASYIDQLIGLGFFESDLGVSGIDREWDKKLIEQLSPLASHWQQITPLLNGLAAIGKLATEYEETADTEKRRQLLAKAFVTFKSNCELLHNPAGEQGKKKEEKETSRQEGKVFRRTYVADFSFDPHRLWYEDTALEEMPAVSPKIRSSLNLLGSLLARMKDFDGCQREQEKMAGFFRSAYGPAATVSALQFYRDYSREKKPEKQSVIATAQREKNNKKALDLFLENLGEQSTADEVCFDRRAVAHIKPVRQWASFAAFFHAYQAGYGKARLVLNGSVEGSGKMFSRFLHLFDNDITEQLRRECNARSNDTLFAEVTDASFFNGNLHPRIMPYEIITPGGHHTLPPSAQLHVDHLTISYDANRERLVLRHMPSHKEVIVFDLGFQNKGSRSKLYSLLCTFNLGPHHNAYALLGMINKRAKAQSSAEDTDGISILPRIVYEDRIVLQRKEWRVPKSKLPVHETAEADWAYFVRIQQWRQNLRIPDEVFVRGSHHKPQYISFRNPLLVALFESSIRNCTDVLRIEEMLPDSNQLATAGGRTIEFLAQWDRLS